MESVNTPIYIYLDQNKWIELAKGLKDGKLEYKNLYSTMKNNVDSGIWAFPLSIIHIAESMKRKNQESKENLLNLMYSLSKGYSICDCTTANTIEFNYWINNDSVDYKKLQNKIISHDLINLIGLSTYDLQISSNGNIPISNDQIQHIKNILINNSCNRDIFNLICQICASLNDDEDFFYNGFLKARDEFNDWLTEIKKFDEYKDKHVYPAYLTTTFFAEYEGLITTVCVSSYYKEKLDKIFDGNTKNKITTINLLESLPGFNVFNRLVYELLTNQSKKVDKHDFFDLAFLRVAIPYCDIVIGENYWIDRIKHYKLDQKFNTISGTKLLELENLLK